MFGWTPGIGDPTIYGWITVAAYAAGAICCWLAFRRAPSRERRFWLVLTCIMAFLCINKQLDLQELITFGGRAEAKAHGWYADRREFQIGFIVALLIASAITLLALFRRAVGASPPVRGGMVGMTLLLLFVLVRASSFHKVDWLINQPLAGFRMNHVLELGGIAIVTWFAVAAARRKRRRHLASI